MSNSSSSVDFLAGFLVGGLVGAAAALLLAPQSGEETRLMIRDKGIELREQADGLTEEAKKRAEGFQVQAKEKAGELQSRVKDAVDEGKTAASSRKEELLASVDQADPASEPQA
jgi:gas vesicle protein